MCEEIHHQLKILIRYLPVKVPDSLLDVIRKKLKEGDADDIKNRDVEFVLIRGKKVKEAFETKRLLLTNAIKIFHVSIVSMCKLLCIIIINLFAVQLVHKSSFLPSTGTFSFVLFKSS